MEPRPWALGAMLKVEGPVEVFEPRSNLSLEPDALPGMVDEGGCLVIERIPIRNQRKKGLYYYRRAFFSI